MKKLLFFLCLISLVGCAPPDAEYGTTSNGSSTYGYFESCEYNGHMYIIYREGFYDEKTLGLEHDPDCGCFK